VEVLVNDNDITKRKIDADDVGEGVGVGLYGMPYLWIAGSVLGGPLGFLAGVGVGAAIWLCGIKQHTFVTGERVYHYLYGWGIVQPRRNDMRNDEIRIRFDRDQEGDFGGFVRSVETKEVQKEADRLNDERSWKTCRKCKQPLAQEDIGRFLFCAPCRTSKKQ
jgi:hypothetical protein